MGRKNCEIIVMVKDSFKKIPFCWKINKHVRSVRRRLSCSCLWLSQQDCGGASRCMKWPLDAAVVLSSTIWQRIMTVRFVTAFIFDWEAQTADTEICREGGSIAPRRVFARPESWCTEHTFVYYSWNLSWTLLNCLESFYFVNNKKKSVLSVKHRRPS